MSASRLGGTAGFTLVELLVVLVIIGVSMSAAAPLIVDLPGAGDRAPESGNLPPLYTKARLLAAQSGRQTEIAWNRSNGLSYLFVNGALRDSTPARPLNAHDAKPDDWWSAKIDPTGLATVRRLGRTDSNSAPGWSLNLWSGHEHARPEVRP